ncbi:MAG: PilZ domain-containing protein [Deltaproteobacteria bacterium]|nr:PilZ domain-containing protein [Deltaproteobacteria bacterium]
MDISNIRHFNRVKVDLGAELLYLQKAFQVEVKDISLGGAYIETPLRLPMEERVELRIFLNNPEHTVEALGRVAWIKPDQSGFGIEFAQLKPIDVWALMRQTSTAPAEVFKLNGER